MSNTFQLLVGIWMNKCFGPDIAMDRRERTDRVIEELFEMVQATGYDRSRILALLDYVYGRPAGELSQEVGGVMVTLAAFCYAHEVSMAECGAEELARIDSPEVMEKIRAKQALKNKIHFGHPLPIVSDIDEAVAIIRDEAVRAEQIEGFNAHHDDTYEHGILSSAAAAYAMSAAGIEGSRHLWPWHMKWWKPSPDNKLRDLAKAGGLIIAEIKRLKRVERNEVSK